MDGPSWVLERDRLQDRHPLQNRPRLFCLPHAGSGSAGYYRWKRLLPEGNVCPVHLPGRDLRFKESPIANGEDLVDALHELMSTCLDRPYAIFGHSMGALLAFAWAGRIQADGLRLPQAVFVSARAPRRRPGPDPDTWLSADDDALLRSVDKRFGGNAHATLQDPELRAAFLPTMRADMHVVETVRIGDMPIAVPLYAACGDADASTSEQEMQQWERHTASHFDAAQFPGGHFYHFTEGQSQLLKWVGGVLNRHIGAF